MRQLYKSFCLILIMLLSISCFGGCAKKEVTCPFTEITWEDSFEEIKALEGEDYEDGESLYYGACYNYPKEYKGVEGTIQYMFDEEDKLACMAWLYVADSSEEIEKLYQTLHDEMVDTYGEGGLDSQFDSQINGDVWYLDGGNIIIIVSTVENYKALQFSFVSPEHSLEEPKK